MKVALIKEVLNVHGPWSSVLWKETDPRRLFGVWPGKFTYWEMTCLLEADWYVISDPAGKSDYIETIRRCSEFVEIISRYTSNVVARKDIPFEYYDIVITLDPVLEVPKASRTLFAYYIQEHWDCLYAQSLRKPLGNYDLFLAHMMDAGSEIEELPQTLSFPYVYDCKVICSTICIPEKEEAAWADWRILTTLGMVDQWAAAAEAAAGRLKQVLRLPIRYNRSGDKTGTPSGLADPPVWGDALHYLEAMARCKYYIGVGRSKGAGQGLCDAASVGCICVGELNRPYHRLICHPACLCSGLLDLPEVVRRVVSSPNLQEEVLDWQGKALRRYFADRPLRQLEQAVALKRQNNAKGRVPRACPWVNV